MKFPIFQFLLIAFCPVPVHHWQDISGSDVFSSSPSSIYTHYVKVHESLSMPSFFSRLNSSSSLSFCSYERTSKQLIILVAFHWTHSKKSTSLLLGSPKLDPVFQLWPQELWGERSPSGNVPPNVAEDTFGKLSGQVVQRRCGCPIHGGV